MRALTLLFAVIGLMLAPFAMGQSRASEMPAMDHGAARMAMNHCDDGGSADGMAKMKLGLSCCVATCSAIAPVAPRADDVSHFVETSYAPRNQHFGPAYLAELPTPPPKAA